MVNGAWVDGLVGVWAEDTTRPPTSASRAALRPHPFAASTAALAALGGIPDDSPTEALNAPLSDVSGGALPRGAGGARGGGAAPQGTAPGISAVAGAPAVAPIPGVTSTGIVATLRDTTAVVAELVVLLPGSASGPLPSPESGLASRARSPRISAWRVPALLFHPAGALRLLGSLSDLGPGPVPSRSRRRGRDRRGGSRERRGGSRERRGGPHVGARPLPPLPRRGRRARSRPGPARPDPAPARPGGRRPRGPLAPGADRRRPGRAARSRRRDAAGVQGGGARETARGGAGRGTGRPGRRRGAAVTARPADPRQPSRPQDRPARPLAVRADRRGRLAPRRENGRGRGTRRGADRLVRRGTRAGRAGQGLLPADRARRRGRLLAGRVRPHPGGRPRRLSVGRADPGR